MTPSLRVRYQTIDVAQHDIHLCTLRDKQQFSDPENVAENLGISSASWPIFGVVWPSSVIMANHMLDFNITGKRILEVGCGMALSSHVLNKRQADVTATDYHPEVEHFLIRNTELNHGRTIPFERADWADDKSELGKFDIIMGSDLLYEDEHIALLATFIQNHANEKCEVILVDPGRGRKNKLTTKMTEYGFTNNHIKPANTDYLQEHFKGFILRFER
ncbi:class I SAM-dependent methyltransferase [Shewanella donghaensis]|uniref:class I SAM-dependent methyltransferase n=1 Tax=Shewanella donghaensis TaxID=238836 RepID=UPI0011831664|nr:methyltransferase domain-containing protein [Shewanella donghaensis]